VAISNGRLVSLEQGRVTFRYKDYADDQRLKLMTLDAEEFIRRFLLHVLPKGFVRIRHYGLLAGRNVDTKLADCRRLLGIATEPADIDPAAETEPTTADHDPAVDECPRCPRCQAPLRRRELPPAYLILAPAPAPLETVAALDSS
jgi:hypothetical protein